LSEQALLETPGRLVDVGFGVSAVTTAELAAAFPSHQVVGLEQDASRVAAAAREAPHLGLRAGGLEVLDGEALVVRVANVARGLSKEDAEALHGDVVPRLVEGGVCLEGSTDVDGHVSAFWVLRRRGAALVREALVLHTDGERGFSPWLFRDVLPRDLRRDVRPGTPIHALLSDWATAWEASRSASPRESFRASVIELAARRADVDSRFVAHGFCAWRP